MPVPFPVTYVGIIGRFPSIWPTKTFGRAICLDIGPALVDHRYPVQQQEVRS